MDRATSLAYIDRTGDVGPRRRVEDFRLTTLTRHRNFVVAAAPERLALFDERLDLRHEWSPADTLILAAATETDIVVLEGVRDRATGLYAGTVRRLAVGDGLQEHAAISLRVAVAVHPPPKLLIGPEGLALVTHNGANAWQECRLAQGDVAFECQEPAWGRDLRALHGMFQSAVVSVAQSGDGYVVTVPYACATTGNLTFRRRDMVTRAQGPVLFARVYDSRIGANDDFGPGWRLSLAEELHVDGDVVTYIGASGARQSFAWDGTGFVASPSTPRHAGTALAFADIDGIRVATLRDGDTTRTFAQADEAGTRYVVRTVRTASRELVLDYGQGRLATVSHNGATLFGIDRDADGRIVEVRDNHGRSVRYTYDFDRRLSTVRDIAGNDWSYTYRSGGRLGAATDPDGRTYLAATYGDDGRVAQSFSRRLYTYAYTDATTTVTEDGGEVHTFGRNRAGVTTALSSTGGVSWRLTLDAANRVTSLTLPERTVSYAYDSGGRVATATVADAVAGATSMRSHTYDAQGRLTGVAGGGRDVSVTHADGHVHIADGDDVFEYHLDRKGRVTSVQQGTDMTIRAERDDVGDIVAISDGYRAVRFGRDALGRIVDAAFADGDSARYFYDDLGNRRLSEYGRGGSVAYVYDEAGSVVGIETTRHDGSVHRPTVTLATAEPIEGMAYDGSLTLSVDYGMREYGPLGTVTEEVTAGPRDVDDLVAASYGDRERRSTDLRVPVMMGDGASGRQPHYGIVVLNQRRQAAGHDSMEAGVPHLNDARALLEVAAPLLGRSGVDGLEMAFNPVFQPPEYRILAAAETAPLSSASTGCVCEKVSDYDEFDSCPAGIVQDAGADAAGDVNGCSQPLPVPTLMQSVFTPSCNTHDVCYNTCQSSKTACDGVFYFGMDVACLGVPWTGLVACGAEATLYFGAVLVFGFDPYEEAQVKHCDCCRVGS